MDKVIVVDSFSIILFRVDGAHRQSTVGEVFREKKIKLFDLHTVLTHSSVWGMFVPISACHTTKTLVVETFHIYCRLHLAARFFMHTHGMGGRQLKGWSGVPTPSLCPRGLTHSGWGSHSLHFVSPSNGARHPACPVHFCSTGTGGHGSLCFVCRPWLVWNLALPISFRLNNHDQSTRYGTSNIRFCPCTFVRTCPPPRQQRLREPQVI